jgi:hypothetical protein
MMILFSQFDRAAIIKYSGMWGWQMPDYASSIIIRYNIMKVQREFIRSLRIDRIVKWLNNII